MWEVFYLPGIFGYRLPGIFGYRLSFFLMSRDIKIDFLSYCIIFPIQSLKNNRN